MTVAIAAQKLLFEAGELEGPYQNILYRTWVVDVDLDKLLRPRAGDDAMKALLSSEFVDDISRQSVMARYKDEAPRPRERHGAVDKQLLRVGLALSNLTGVDYSLPLRPTGTFNYTQYVDNFVSTFDETESEQLDTEAKWEPLRAAAVSCGAFPSAFRPVELNRRPADFPFTTPPPVPLVERSSIYTDGGTSDNEPLGLAKNLVDLVDKHRDSESRFYLFVAPRALQSTVDAEFTAETTTYAPFAKRLVTAIFDQAGFQDWVTAEALNEWVAIFNDWARRMIPVVQEADADRLAVLEASTKLLLGPLVEGRKAYASSVPRHTPRNLLYTGITRGKRLVILVGSKRALAIAVKNNSTDKRHTMLEERLRGMAADVHPNGG